MYGWSCSTEIGMELGSTVIGTELGSTEIGLELGSTVNKTELGNTEIGMELGSTVIGTELLKRSTVIAYVMYVICVLYSLCFCHSFTLCKAHNLECRHNVSHAVLSVRGVQHCQVHYCWHAMCPLKRWCST